MEQIRRADYEGDRASLRTLHTQLAAEPVGNASKSLVLYWRGFALWRRSINGFNETPTPDDLDADLVAAIAEFEAALREDPKTVESRAGLASCLGLRVFLKGKGKLDDEGRAALTRSLALMKEGQELEPDNPRLLWVMGPALWWTPPGSPPETVDQRQGKAIANYQRGLEAFAKGSAPAGGSLQPTWGEPELHMSLGWSYLKRRVPDLVQADAHARKALELVPTWHYVRDILVPQIETARRTASR